MIKILFHHHGTQKQEKAIGCAFNSALSKVRQSKGAGQALVNTTPGAVIDFLRHRTITLIISTVQFQVTLNVNLSPLE